MKIALIQLHATRDREDNIARSINALEKAAAQGTQLAAFAGESQARTRYTHACIVGIPRLFPPLFS